ASATPPAQTNANANSVTTNMDAFTVAAGQEVFMCQDFDNPFGGKDVAIGQSTSDMTRGSHHLHVFYGVGSPLHRPAAACENHNEFRPILHLSTLPHLTSAYDPGTAAKLKGATGLRLQVHYLNSTSAPVDAHVSLTLTTVDPASVQRWVAQLHFNRVAM